MAARKFKIGDIVEYKPKHKLNAAGGDFEFTAIRSIDGYAVEFDRPLNGELTATVREIQLWKVPAHEPV